MKFISRSSSETADFAGKYVGDIVKDRPKTGGAFVLGLYGNLGSGKTTFTQAAASALGVREQVTSPTFVIEKIYPLPHSLSTPDPQVSAQSSGQFTASAQPFRHFIHIDAYRLESADEMKHLGWDEIARNPDNFIVIEWPERIAALLPADHARLRFAFIDETTRSIESGEYGGQNGTIGR